jgi:hypothetical protein
MHTFTKLYQSINIHSEQLKKVAVNPNLIATKNTVNHSLKNKAEIRFQNKISSIIKNNKLSTFAIIFVSVNLIFSLQPSHIKRPEVLARNRLEKKENPK